MTIDEMRKLPDNTLLSLFLTTTRGNETEAGDFIKVLVERGYTQDRNGCWKKKSI